MSDDQGPEEGETLEEFLPNVDIAIPEKWTVLSISCLPQTKTKPKRYRVLLVRLTDLAIEPDFSRMYDETYVPTGVAETIDEALQIVVDKAIALDSAEETEEQPNG